MFKGEYSMTLHVPFHYDYVGSFLRPEKLRVARLAFEQGKITKDELKAIEDEQIVKLIEKQKAAGFHVITDGEFRRGWWHMDFFWGLEGIEKVYTKEGLAFHGEKTKNESARIIGKISGKNHPFVEHFKFVKEHEDENTIAKQTIPAPAQLLAQLNIPEYLADNLKVYPDRQELLRDIGKAYQEVIADLYAAGCRNIQLDDCTWTLYADKSVWYLWGLDDEKLQAIAEEQIYLNNLALENKPDDLVVTTHVCRGNFHSTYASTGAYDPIAPYLFAKENVDALYLEYDDERSGGFEPLKYVSDNKKVVLGLITTKRPELEDKEVIKKRIEEATKYIPLERLCLSPQCGFASTEEGNKLTEKEQWAKLQLVKEIAEEVWGK